MDEKKINLNFPENSHRMREKKPPEPQKEKKKNMVKGKITVQKKSLSKRFTDTFLGASLDGISSYIINDVLIPAAKGTFVDMVNGIFDGFKNAAQIAVFGEVRNSRNTNIFGNTRYVNYNRMSERTDGPGPALRNRARYGFDEIIFDSRAEAIEVRNYLVDLIADYQVASVADYYDAVNVPSTFTDGKWGWTKLNTANVEVTNGGFIINLPRATPID